MTTTATNPATKTNERNRLSRDEVKDLIATSSKELAGICVERNYDMRESHAFVCEAMRNEIAKTKAELEKVRARMREAGIR